LVFILSNYYLLPKYLKLKYSVGAGGEFIHYHNNDIHATNLMNCFCSRKYKYLLNYINFYTLMLFYILCRKNEFLKSLATLSTLSTVLYQLYQPAYCGNVE